MMTREEAIAVLAESKRQNEVMRDNPSTFWASHQMADGVKNAERRIAALDMALSALRPVSREQELEAENKELKERIVNWRKYMTPTREQVEKVWKGEWIGDNDEKVGTIDGSPIKSSTCSVCGNWLVGSDEYDCSGHFCPACGRAMTDEAVQMVMERLEALHDTGN